MSLHTKWADSVSRDCPLPEYPRPQLARARWQCLNGPWQFTLCHDHTTEPAVYDREILVPYCVESELSGVQEKVLPEDQMWYRRTFTVPEEWKNDRILLHFGAVDWEAAVYVNGIKAGAHQGGYLPFSFDITELLQEENELVVSVQDPTDQSYHQLGKQSLHPATVFYTATSGIWQTVWLEPVPKSYIYGLTIVPDLAASSVSITVQSETDSLCKVRISDREGQEILQTELPSNTETSIRLEDPHLWSPDDPHLYSLHVEMDGDQVDSYFGMRSIGTVRQNGRDVLALNGKPLFHLGVLDQGYWPESILTPVSEEAMRFDILQLKELGFNMIRKHIKVEPLRWYYLCDTLGMLVWQDMVAGGNCHPTASFYAKMALGLKMTDNTEKDYADTGRSEKASRDDFEDELDGMIRLLFNDPSIVVWVPFNEHWGQYDSTRIADHVKSLDPSRLVDHASGWLDTGAGDFASYHQYFKKLSVPKNLDSRVFVISECGGFGFETPGHVYSRKAFSYGRFKSKAKLDERYRAFIEEEAVPLKEKGLSTLVYTQLSDVEIEENGLFTYDRKVLKFTKEKMKAVNEKLTAPLAL